MDQANRRESTMSLYWRLDGMNKPVPCSSAEFAEMYRDDFSRRVDWTELHTPSGRVVVSTVFLSLDHSFGDGPPVLFETMTFGGQQDGNQCRYRTWDEAVAGHATVVEGIKARYVGAFS